MPRNVRNYWIEANIDGRPTRIAAGPRRKDGGFALSVLMRDQGGIVDALTVEGYADPDGTLTLNVFNADANNIYQRKAQR